MSQYEVSQSDRVRIYRPESDGFGQEEIIADMEVSDLTRVIVRSCVEWVMPAVSELYAYAYGLGGQSPGTPEA